MVAREEFVDILDRRKQAGVGLTRLTLRRCTGWTVGCRNRLGGVVDHVEFDRVDFLRRWLPDDGDSDD